MYMYKARTKANILDTGEETSKLNMDHKTCVGLIVLLASCGYGQSPGCGNGQVAGLWPGPFFVKDLDDGTHLLELNHNYEVPCNGVITKWKARIARPIATATYTLKLQVFRNTDDIHIFKFIGENAFNVRLNVITPSSSVLVHQ